jgi:hypothetical protein
VNEVFIVKSRHLDLLFRNETYSATNLGVDGGDNLPAVILHEYRLYPVVTNVVGLSSHHRGIRLSEEEFEFKT